MYTYTTTILVIAVGVLTVSAQYQQPSSANYVDDYADYEAGRPAAHAAPRSYDSGAAAAQRAAPPTPKPTPVAILKQINRHNEDGSYTYGFEGADGSFKIETKLPNGEVKGKYGFVDDTGVARVVEYGADQYGFQPAGDGITVAPPTLVDETTSKEALEAQAYQDYQDALQRQQAAAARPAPAPTARPQPAAAPRPQYTQALFSAAQASAPSAPKPPIFTPSAQAALLPRGQDYNAPRQSQLLQAYDEPSPPSQVYNQGPAQFSPAPVQEHRSQPQTRSHQPGTRGILDQLARDYALPQNSAAPLHDISFGYY